ncbi:hypothetical protein ACI8AC_16015 [Geodermatophilus sp. SYSU D00758]
MRFHVGFDTAATPEQVLDAFTDTTDRRLDIWRSTLDPAKYEVRERGDTWAVVREGSAGTRIWVLLRYDWAERGVVRWELVDSDHCDTGRGEVRATPRAEGGSRVDVVIDHRSPRGLRGRTILLVQRLVGPIAFARMWRRTLDRLAAAPGTSGAEPSGPPPPRAREGGPTG